MIVALALACSVGLHWAFLQSFAWSTMLVDNLTTSSFSVAIQRTFDGKHPCALCKAIDEGKKSERKSDTLVSLKKFEGLNEPVSVVIFPTASFPTIDAQDATFETILPTPPTPPPRAA
jgi:hypothetical protein